MTNSEKELERLIKSQRNDERSQRQRPQTVRGRRTILLDSRATRNGEAYNLAVEEPGFERIEDELSPDEPKVETESEARTRAVREAVASLSAFEQRVYELTYGGGYVKSSREVTAEFDGAVSQSTVSRAQRSIERAVRAALEGEAT